MDRLKISLVLLLIGCFTACTAPKFYKEIKEIDKEQINRSKEDRRIWEIKKDHIDIDKYFLRFLKEELKDTNHIYYWCLPMMDNAGFDRIDACIYDVDNNKYYYLTNNDYFSKKINIQDVSEEMVLLYYKIIYEHFTNGNCEKLKALGELGTDASTLLGTQAIYEIDLKNNFIKKCSFLEILDQNYYPY